MPEETPDSDATEPEPTPLLQPADGVPELTTTDHQITAAAELLASGHGPFAVDAERASGFRYSSRAYLIQIRRAGAGTVLVDPVGVGADPIEALRPIADVLSTDAWILHAADQDLPCLAEVGMSPRRLYDTELAGRLAGYDRVNLAAMVGRLLGLGLAKGHGAADWSKRPLPPAWLNYAALDVEVLLDLQTAVAAVLADQGKTEWAAEEFEYLRTADPAPQRRDRWRRTSGIHKVRDPRGLAAVHEMWVVRDDIARRRDIAPGRILPDSSIIAAATADPKTVEDLTALPIFGGPRQRRSANTWLAALARARDHPEPLSSPEAPNGPPPVSRWHRRKPEAAARLKVAREGLVAVSERVGVPTENLVSPELVRRLCWDWQDSDGSSPSSSSSSDERLREEQTTDERLREEQTTVGEIDAFLRDGGARPWQRALTVPALAQALTRAAD